MRSPKAPVEDFQEWFGRVFMNTQELFESEPVWTSAELSPQSAQSEVCESELLLSTSSDFLFLDGHDSIKPERFLISTGLDPFIPSGWKLFLNKQNFILFPDRRKTLNDYCKQTREKLMEKTLISEW